MRLIFTMALVCLSLAAHGEIAPQFEQHLGQRLPLHTAFVDAQNRKGTLDEYFGDTPVVLVFGYYHCPRLCSTVMDGVLQGIQNAGLPYTIVGIGIDPQETPQDAAQKLVAYRTADETAGNLHLLTGQQAQI